ncbi:hypothetical protein V2G26_005842 [Clonostachys chloroleuca]
MDANQSPLSTSDTTSCFTPYPADSRKRKRSVAGSQPPREYGLMRDSGEHGVARFVGSGSGIHYIRAVYLRLARKSASRTAQTNTAAVNTLVPGEDDQLRQSPSDNFDTRKPIWKPHEVSSVALADSHSPSFESLIDWSKSFFESWHPVLPFLHGPDVLHIFEEASSKGVASLSVLDYNILRSVLSISLADSRQGMPLSNPIPSHLVFQSVEEAVTSSQFALSQPASIRATQAALSIQLFLTSMLYLNAASRLGGLIVRMAFHLGLHRCPARFGFFGPEDASIRRRVLWCIYILERFLCQSLGLPLDIRDDDLDVCYPGEERHGVPGANNDGVERLQLLTLLAKHARIRGLILELRNKSVQQRQDTADKTAVVQIELARWANEIQDVEEEEEEEPDAVEESDKPGHRPNLSPSHRLMLLVLKHESTICLNRPALASEPSLPSYSSAFQSCISAAKSICSIFNRHKRKYKLANGESGKRLGLPLLWPSFTWSIWISAFVLLHATFENQVPLSRAMRHAMAGKETLSHLAMRQTAWPEYCLEAIDELLSAVQEMSHHPPAIGDLPPTVPSHQGHIDKGTSQPASLGPRSKRPASGARWNMSSGVPDGSGTRHSLHESQGTGEAHERNHGTVSLSEPSISPPQPAPPESHGPLQPRPQIAPGVSYNINTPNSNRFDVFNSGITETLGGSAATGPLEGQDSLIWYDQLFASSFNAIDNPFLVASDF